MFDPLLRLLSILALLGALAVSLDANAQNIERGRELYENHCRTCHTEQVHGRRNRSALSVGDLREIVDQWQANQGLSWSREEIDDVVLYLANSRYFFVTRSVR